MHRIAPPPISLRRWPGVPFGRPACLKTRGPGRLHW